jgi:IS5 family transposase
MKLHIGVDKDTGLTHGTIVTAACLHDKHLLPQPLNGKEEAVYRERAAASSAGAGEHRHRAAIP